MASPQSDAFTSADGWPIAYSLWSQADRGAARVVLIHSLGLDASIWNGVAEALASRAEIVALDCRGHGRSGRAPGPYSVAQFARDVVELLDHLGWPQAVVAGCSMGGCVAQAVAGLFPERCSGLGLIDTTAWYGSEARETWRGRAANARAKGFAAMADFQMTRWFGEAFRRDHADQARSVMAILAGTDIDCYEASCNLLGEADLRPLLARIKVPVEIVVGEEDHATPVEAARALQAALPSSNLTVLEGARHITPCERPGDIAERLARLF